MFHVYRHLEDLPLNRPVVMAIGNFDGMHLGHQSLITQTIHLAKIHHAEPWVMTFEPHASEFFTATPPPRLHSLREKCQALFSMGIEAIWCETFHDELAQQPPESFLSNRLCKRLSIQHIVVGEDFQFGHKRSGNIETLKKFGKNRGFEVSACPPVLLDGKRISSTDIRRALHESNFALAETLLGKPYTISGRVLHGDHLGRQLGFPTANLKWSKCASPLHGVYVVSVTGVHNDHTIWHPAAASLGVRPSVQGTDFRCEIHLLNFSGNLYGQHLTVQFHQKLHDERQYDTLQQLQNEIANDICQTQHYFAQQGYSP